MPRLLCEKSSPASLKTTSMETKLDTHRDTHADNYLRLGAGFAFLFVAAGPFFVSALRFGWPEFGSTVKKLSTRR